MARPRACSMPVASGPTGIRALPLPLLLFLVAGAAAQGSSRAQSLAGSKPNVLVLFADDLGYGDLSCYGNPTIQTPNTDQLAAEGIRFTQWYSAFHICSPSRAAMMTGRLPVRSGCMGTSWEGGVFSSTAVGGLPLNETTMAELLKPAGYRTAAIGKWHLGQRDQFLPTSRGFDSYLGIPFSVDMGRSAWNTYTHLEPLPLLGNQTVLEQPTDLDKLSDQYRDFATGFMDSSIAANDPFFLYFAFNHVHTPDFVSQPFCNSSLRGLFGDALQEMDTLLGAVMDHLRASSAANNTIVFFSSDNGPWTAKHLDGGDPGGLRDGKGTTYEGGIREPGIAWWPGKIQPNQVVPAVVATYDIFPTVAALAGVALPTDRVFDGRDMSPVLFDNQHESQHDCLFHYKGIGDFGSAQPGLWAVRCGAYKMHFVIVSEPAYIKYMAPGLVQNPPLLYQIEHDPRERYPISPKNKEYATANATIHAAIKQHLLSLSAVPNQMGMGTDDKYAVCGCPDTTPRCTCNPENYKAFVCHDEL